MSILTYNLIFILNMFIQFYTYGILISSIIRINNKKVKYLSIIGITLFSLFDLFSLIFIISFNLLTLSNELLNTTIFLSIQSLFFILSTLLLHRSFAKLNLFENIDLLSKKDYRNIIILLVIAYISAVPLLTFSYIELTLSISIFTYFIAFFRLIVLTLSISLITYINKLVSIKVKLENIKIENQNMQALVDKVRICKHDYSNTMASIAGYISLNDMNGLKKYFSRISKELDEINLLQSINTNTINEPSIFSIIHSKYNEAKNLNITFNFYSTLDYKNLNMPVYDFSKILGIFMDNAIYNASLSDEKEIFLSIESKKDGSQILNVKNSYINKDVDTNAIFEKGFSTKSVKSGLGLWEVKEIISNSKYSNLYTTKDENYFVQTLVIMPNNQVIATY